MSRHAAVEQPRDALGQFASRECPTTYRLLVADPPDGQRPDPHQPGRTLLAVARCTHGHFARWAARNCRPCLATGATR